MINIKSILKLKDNDGLTLKNGKPINPLTIKSQPKKPISEENRMAFNILRDSLVNRLSLIDMHCHAELQPSHVD